MLYSLFKERWADKIIEEIRFADRVFSGFIGGKLLDSAIIGGICYIGMMIMGLPYAILISVIVGVTNIIPFFGPYIGAIPSAIILLTVSPMSCLMFVIFIVILQQVDGNIIGPNDSWKQVRDYLVSGCFSLFCFSVDYSVLLVRLLAYPFLRLFMI